jgi:hypothetical protein
MVKRVASPRKDRLASQWTIRKGITKKAQRRRAEGSDGSESSRAGLTIGKKCIFLDFSIFLGTKEYN